MTLASKILLLLLTLLVTSGHVMAGDTHQNDGEAHRVIYVITDGSGNPVAGQTVRLAVHRASDDATYDFSDSQFKFSGWTTKLQTMNYNPNQELYQFTFSPDVARPRIASGDYIIVVSNDDATYGDQQAESVSFGSTNQLIRISR